MLLDLREKKDVCRENGMQLAIFQLTRWFVLEEMQEYISMCWDMLEQL